MLVCIKGGPADGQRIEMVALPSRKRWFCQMTGVKQTWWVVDEEPPSDASLTVTPYALTSSVTDAEHGIVHTFTPAK